MDACRCTLSSSTMSLACPGSSLVVQPSTEHRKPFLGTFVAPNHGSVEQRPYRIREVVTCSSSGRQGLQSGQETGYQRLKGQGPKKSQGGREEQGPDVSADEILDALLADSAPRSRKLKETIGRLVAIEALSVEGYNSEDEDDEDASRFSHVLGGIIDDGSDSEGADEADEGSARVEEQSGNPLGRKVLGKAALSWLSEGLRIMAEELVGGSAPWVVQVGGEDFSLVSVAEKYLGKVDMPRGAEDKCRLGAKHVPTVWDNLQRQTQAIVKEKGDTACWKETLAWQTIKRLAKTGAHRQAARATPVSSTVTPPGASLRLSPQEQSRVAAQVNSYVDLAEQLLEAERKAEVEATKRALDGASPPAEEEDRDNSIRKLLALRSSTGLGGVHLVTFRASGPPGTKLPPSAITPGDLVYVRPEWGGGPAWGEELKGTVQALGEDGKTLVVALEKRMGDPATAKIFGRVLRVDRVLALADAVTYERNRSALVALRRAGTTGRTAARRIITTLFSEGLPLFSQQAISTDLVHSNSQEGGSQSGLDASQLQAVEHALDGRVPVAVIQGPPGTGKTVTLVEIVRRAVKEGQRVLVTAPTNAAVDNMVERLSQQGLDVIRMGNPARMSPAVTSRSLNVQVDAELADWRRDMARRRADLRADLRSCAFDSEMVAGLRSMLKKLGKTLKQTEKDTVERLLTSAEVIVCTNTGAGDPLVKRQGPFDLVLVDEAGQATEPSTWVPLLQGRRAVLAGDSCQLAPMVLSREALEGGLNVSLLERATNLHQGYLLRMLQVQYRMHVAISDWASQEMYGGVLRAAEQVAGRLLSDRPGVASTSDTATPMLLLDTRRPRGSLLPGCEEQLDPSGSGSLFNLGEAEIVTGHVAALLEAGVSPREIAVQSPYLAQVELLRQRIGDLGEAASEVEVASVDSFQGREADAVIISMVRSNFAGTVGFLGDNRRMNVAVTRARMHVAVVCDSTTVASNPFLLRLLKHIRTRGEVRHATLLGGSGDIVLQPSTSREKALIGQGR